jgi:hypothetical protein
MVPFLRILALPRLLQVLHLRRVLPSHESPTSCPCSMTTLPPRQSVSATCQTTLPDLRRPRRLKQWADLRRAAKARDPAAGSRKLNTLSTDDLQAPVPRPCPR